ncbi:ABC transporter ATP-binding protein [Candidatus Enterococcus ferrettii]|uniref:ABC transporter domain-containing protein n=1 Tax=Candidatus Enterococcus ferrettii TaxID=2815324 RepID=A0ABV0EZU0_9ENTE|nr:ABC transporter ATP-binding protein [Enterococcus sp. 665A]MBO1338762.1 ABC transporter ATP-binding protein [Enterococcus sp. 665A]
MTYIQATNLQKNYLTATTEIPALKNVTFAIEKGEFTVILGPSGSGKTTLLNLLGGMDKATSGELIVNQNTIHSFKDRELTNYRRHSIGFIFQFYNLIPTLTALENVAIAQRIAKDPFEATEILTRVQMSHRLNNFPQELSGGEQQRVSIARAVCKNPQLILCDEPTGALDSTTGQQVLYLLKEMSEVHGHTIIVVTHNAAIAQIADRVIHLKDGAILKNDRQLHPLKIDEVSW